MAEAAGPLRAVPMLVALGKHQVRFVVVGSYGAIVQNVDLPLTDIDIVPDDSDVDNLRRLAFALTELGAAERGVTEYDAEDLRREMASDPTVLTSAKFWSFDTAFGGVDLVFRPAGFERGYRDLAGSARRVRLADADDPTLTAEVLVADVRDIYRSKRSAGRPKDTQVLHLFVGIHDPDPRRTLAERYWAAPPHG